MNHEQLNLFSEPVTPESAELEAAVVSAAEHPEAPETVTTQPASIGEALGQAVTPVVVRRAVLGSKAAEARARQAEGVAEQPVRVRMFNEVADYGGQGRSRQSQIALRRADEAYLRSQYRGRR